MTRRRIAAVCRIALGTAIVSTLSLVLAGLGNHNSFAYSIDDPLNLNQFLIWASLGMLAAGTATGALAAVAARGAQRVPRWIAGVAPTLGALSAAAVWYQVGGWLITSNLSDGVLRCGSLSNGVCTPPGPDFTWLFICLGAIVLNLAATALYTRTPTGQPRVRAGRASRGIFLLLSAIPLLNIVGAFGLMMLSTRRGAANPTDVATPARPAVSG